MIDALSIAASGLDANQAWIDSISNNIANMQTPGYRKSRVNFQDLVQQQSGNPLDRMMEPNRVMGAGVKISQPGVSMTEGSISQTNNPLDIAIQGKGFFEVLLPGGDAAYTRAGRFHQNAEGRLVIEGDLELSGDIRIPPDAASISITADGRVQARLAGVVEPVELGQLRIARFANGEGLQRLNNGLLQPTQQSGDVVLAEPGTNGTGSLLQGHLELSNVNLVEEMTSLVLAQRAYQLNARILQASDQILETLNNLRR
ncbi:MAG: flagellar basal-body rod protein FlgG [Fluviicoccus sp.]|uniref:flagellar basal-body rod protein FlgG n=1 Tax=Fluviicoccus sp. TaxID=2003552 RepID=UPI00271E3323|nr:flagellar basal-body rod protein FlgG [Fluviicoccus sp.]MDO8330479.1 flagellar basal-body rod protein FlgG [Fluviicoccus sp.]